MACTQPSPSTRGSVRARARRGSALVLLCAAHAVGGCGPSAQATPVTGPDGSAGWWRVTCRDDHQDCLDEADELCASGYDLERAQGRYDVGPGFPYYSGVVLVRCKDER